MKILLGVSEAGQVTPGLILTYLVISSFVILLKKLKEHSSNPVDGDEVPVPHFGVILSFNQFDDSCTTIKK
jgi:extradiol dioxygenase family protein